MIGQTESVAQFEKAFAHTQREISTLRTGRASVQMLDEVLVDAYGSKMHLNEIGAVTSPDPTLLVVSPWDKSLLGAVEKAIQTANLNLNPIVDSEVVKIPVPPLTQERREEMIKIFHQKAEGGRVLMRSIRGGQRDEIENQEGEAGVSEDDVASALKELEETTKKYIAKVDKLVTNKEKELITL